MWIYKNKNKEDTILNLKLTGIRIVPNDTKE